MEVVMYLLFTETYFKDFETAYNTEDRKTLQDERLTYISRAEITQKNDSLDLGLMVDDSLTKAEDLGEPIDIAQDALAELEAITSSLNNIIKELK